MIPLGDATPNRPVKHPNVDAGQDEQDHFHPKENALVGPDGDRVEQEPAGDDHHDETRDSPRQEFFRDFRDRDLSQSKAQKPEIQNHSEAEEQSERPHMSRLDEGVNPERFVKRNAPRRLRQPLAES